MNMGWLLTSLCTGPTRATDDSGEIRFTAGLAGNVVGLMGDRLFRCRLGRQAGDLPARPWALPGVSSVRPSKANPNLVHIVQLQGFCIARRRSVVDWPSSRELYPCMPCEGDTSSVPFKNMFGTVPELAQRGLHWTGSWGQVATAIVEIGYSVRQMNWVRDYCMRRAAHSRIATAGNV